jgi:uncharacterized ion transporter superfamily protein YfcC
VIKRKFKVPHTLVILFSMVVLAQILTYVIPAGSFDRFENEIGRQQVVPGRVRERGMRRFKSAVQAQRFLSSHAAVYNLFNFGSWAVAVV